MLMPVWAWRIIQNVTLWVFQSNLMILIGLFTFGLWSMETWRSGERRPEEDSRRTARARRRGGCCWRGRRVRVEAALCDCDVMFISALMCLFWYNPKWVFVEYKH
ncbi:hypothetical protein HanIR_Chr08g0375741 [Helianthus annuus]|nr:hypothetical protein HanIR_Chr08g0375741 [Helianthus annuus]